MAPSAYYWHLFTIILYLTSNYLPLVHTGTAFCTFEHTTTYNNDLITDSISGYLCKLDLDVKGERVDHIGGSHPNGETSSQVDIIMVLKEYLTYLTSFPDTFCNQFKNLEIIDMSGAEIETIEKNALVKCKNLRILQFYMNNIKELPENLLVNNGKLLKLFISYNSITTLPENLFSGLTNLEVLDLSYNNLTSMSDEAFRDLIKLKELSMEGNKIEGLETRLFKNLENLEKLNLAGNLITDLPSLIFSSLNKLKELFLQNNQLTVIHADSFAEESKIDLVVLSKNKIDALDEYFIDSCGITKLKMGGNVCVRTMTLTKKDMKKRLRKCFKNYEKLYRETTDPIELETTTTTEFLTKTKRTTTPPTTTTKPLTTTTYMCNTKRVTPTTTVPTTTESTTTIELTTTTMPKKTTKTTTTQQTTTTEKATTTTENITTTTENITTTTEIPTITSTTTKNLPIKITKPPTGPKISAVYEPCGVAKVGVPNIVGGEEISPNTHPWIVALIHKNEYFCGGSLVTNRKVVTAAHCILAKDSPEKEAEDIMVILGGHNLDNAMEVGRVSTGVKSIKIHRDWNPRVEKFDADIAVLVLEDEIDFNYYIQPVCMTRIGKDILSYTEGIIVGFGKSEDSKSHQNFPMKANTPIRTATECYEEFPNLLNIASHRTFCGGFANGTGSCTGDSGGGLTIVSGGRHFLRGVISASLYDQKYGCDVNSYSIFTDMRFYVKFVNDVEV